MIVPVRVAGIHMRAKQEELICLYWFPRQHKHCPGESLLIGDFGAISPRKVEGEEQCARDLSCNKDAGCQTQWTQGS